MCYHCRMLFLLQAALALDLDLSITPPGGTPYAVTLHDIVAGPQLALLVPSDDGSFYRVQLNVEADGDNIWRLSFEVETQAMSGKNRLRTVIVGRPVIRVRGDEWASFSQGSRIPIPDTNPVEFETREFKVEAMVVTGAQ